MLKTLKNLLSLTVRVEDFNLVAQKPDLLKKLRSLTLHCNSGMNHELNQMLRIINTRPVQCKIIMAFSDRQMVGWALLSREKSDFCFTRSYSGFDPKQGALFQVYVDPKHRRKGIASHLLKVARKRTGATPLCVCPHDYSSDSFYEKFDHFNYNRL
jgi:GNAT superfamily N-acetyltransferase